jgi:hypothetical protein
MDKVLQPRQQLMSVPYALQAQEAGVPRRDTSLAPTFLITSTGTVGQLPKVVEFVDSSGGAITRTLPAANAVPRGGMVVVLDHGHDAGTNNITIARAGSDTINKAASNVVLDEDGKHAVLISDGVNNWTAQVG